MKQQQPPYEYIARYVSNYDGDTAEFLVDVGFRMTVRDSFRLWGINTPELKGNTIEAGRIARDVLATRLKEHETFLIRTHHGTEKYGRWLCEIMLPGESMTLNDWMVAKGFAKEYMR